MTATGELKPCLCYRDTMSVRDAARYGTDSDIREKLQEAIQMKPKQHCFDVERGYYRTAQDGSDRGITGGKDIRHLHQRKARYREARDTRRPIWLRIGESKGDAHGGKWHRQVSLLSL